uniref:PPPDE domain-containing protein n=1 Tax=Plectus sambesii TaxID=2011161 RepID=A0A914VZC3_9BILA
MSRTPVRLNVYDMYWLNEYASTVGIGVFHTGIEVYGVEYAYGGHPFAFSGIFDNTPQDAEELGENFKFRESILVGETDFTAGDVRHMIQLMGHEYKGDRYHLISKNCNHFTAALAKTLTGKDIPGWVNRLASISGSIPFLERCIPQEWLTPVALQQSLERRQSASNGAAVDSGSGQSTPEDDAAIRRTSSSAANSRHAPPPSVGAPPTSSNNGFRWSSLSSIGSAFSLSSTNGQSPRGRDFDGGSTNLGSARSESPAPSLTRFWNSLRSLGDKDGGAANSKQT